MTKPTLTQALEAKAKADAEAKAKAEAAAQAEASAQETPGDAQPEASNNGKADAKADDPPAAEAAEKSLEDYRAAFGKEQGSVYFADGVSFQDACLDHNQTLRARVESLEAENAELKQQNANLSKEVLGESEPVHTASKGGSTVDAKAANRTGSEGKAAYAAHLSKKINGTEA